MRIEQELRGLDLDDVSITIKAPEEWGKEVMSEHPHAGELTRSYWAIETYIEEVIEEGGAEVEELGVLPASEEEHITIYVDGEGQ